MSMKFTIQDGPFTYSVDWSVQDKIEDGWLEEYHASTDEMLDAVIHLLECVYPEEEIRKELENRCERGE